MCDSHADGRTGTCIGARNYRFFYSFVASTTIYALAVFVFSLVHLILLTFYLEDEESSVAPFFRAIAAAPAPYPFI